MDAKSPLRGVTIVRDFAACHNDTGTGAAGLFPRLAGSPAVQSDDPTTLIHTVLFGAKGGCNAGRADRTSDAELRLAA